MSALASILPLALVALSDTPYCLLYSVVTVLATLALGLSFWTGVVTVPAIDGQP